MPDDRYQWLDEEAAERLLRGLPADGRREQPEETSARALADALEALVAESVEVAGRRPTDEPLTGEDAAVAAFREAQAGVLRSGSVSSAGSIPAARPARNGPVRSFFSALTGRPIGAGLAAAIAACALGGVAVAAGTGVLPTPFGDDGGSPAPLVSTSSPAIPDGHGGAGGHGHGTHEPTAGPTGGETSSGTSGSGDPAPGDDGAAGDLQNDDGFGDVLGPGLTGAQKKALALALCDAYEKRELDKGDRHKLEKVAGSAGEVRGFCERLGGGDADEGVVGDGATGGSAGSGSGGPGAGDGSATEGGDGGDSGDGRVGGQVGGTASGGATGGDSGGDDASTTEGGDGGETEGGDGSEADGDAGDGGDGETAESSPSPTPTETGSASTSTATPEPGETGDTAR